MKDHCSAWAEGGGGLCDEHAGFQCEYCKKILGSLTHWREHMMAAHLVVIQEYELRDKNRNKEDSEKEFVTGTRLYRGVGKL